jgi:hypothetical protein
MKKQINEYKVKGKPLLSFCLFIDILGFSREIIDAEATDTKEKHFKNIYHSFTDATKSLRGKDKYSLKGDDDGKQLWEIKLFSDNVLLGSPVLLTNNGGFDHEDIFGYVITEVIQFQIKMAIDGWFLRGGWSLGFLYMDEMMAYGKALIDAYVIESKQAINPCIQLSSSMNHLVEEHLSYYAEVKFSPHHSELLVNSHGNYFINYLIAIKQEDDEGNSYVDKKKLEIHKQNILKNYKASQLTSDVKEKDKIMKKYEWLIDYHNFFIKTFLGSTYNIFEIKKSFNTKLYLLKK